MTIQRNGDKRDQPSEIDFAFVTALPIERDAMLRRLEGLEVVQDDFEPLTYYWGQISVPATGERYEAVVIMLLGMGNDEAAVSTVRVVERWRPAYVTMVGIAGGVPGKVAFGDVVVADFAYYYELAKRTPKGEQRRAQQFFSDRLLYGRALAYESSEWRGDITIALPGTTQADIPFPKVRFWCHRKRRESHCQFQDALSLTGRMPQAVSRGNGRRWRGEGCSSATSSTTFPRGARHLRLCRRTEKR